MPLNSVMHADDSSAATGVRQHPLRFASSPSLLPKPSPFVSNPEARPYTSASRVHDGCNIPGLNPVEARDWTQPMLHKCANPSCTAPFRSLREGRLFLAETLPESARGPSDGNRRKLRRREHFWLCDACSAHFTLRFDSEQGMLTVPLTSDVSPRFLTRAASERY